MIALLYISVVRLGYRYVDLNRNPLNFISFDNIWSELIGIVQVSYREVIILVTRAFLRKRNNFCHRGSSSVPPVKSWRYSRNIHIRFTLSQFAVAYLHQVFQFVCKYVSLCSYKISSRKSSPSLNYSILSWLHEFLVIMSGTFAFLFLSLAKPSNFPWFLNG